MPERRSPKLNAPIASVIVVRLIAVPLAAVPLNVTVTPLMPASPAWRTPSFEVSMNTDPAIVDTVLAKSTRWLLPAVNVAETLVGDDAPYPAGRISVTV